LASLDNQGRSRVTASEQVLGGKSITRGTKKALTPSQRNQLQVLKAKELGLHQDSGLPMFSHKLTVEGTKDHPEIDIWHKHREALQRNEIKHDDLPPHFRSLRGDFKFDTNQKEKQKKKREGEQKKEDRYELQNKRTKHSDTRRAKLNELRLDRNSGIPTFAQNKSLQQIKDHLFINEWHYYRDMMEKGLIKQKDLPLHLSNPLLELILKTGKKKGPAVKYGNMTKKERIRIQKMERYAKVMELGLHRNSAMPIWAQRLTAEEIRHHKEIHNWHYQRQKVERGEKTVDDLPAHFQSHRGKLLLRGTGSKKTTAVKTRVIDGQYDQDKDSASAHLSAMNKDKDVSEDQVEDYNSGSDKELWDILDAELGQRSK
jgi:hypothetical protein